MAADQDIIIRPAAVADAEQFPAIENSAGMLFEQCVDLAWLTQEDDRPVAEYEHFVGQGLSWAAVTPAERCVGFLCSGLEDSALHIWELAVCRSHQGRGIGRALLETAVREAGRRGLAALTLTTFNNVAWNAPFYERLGFRIMQADNMPGRLRSMLDEEVERGIPRRFRCAMQLGLSQMDHAAALP